MRNSHAQAAHSSRSALHPLPPAHYEFTVDGCKAPWRLVRALGREAISDLYAWTLDLETDERPDPGATGWLHRPCTLRITRGHLLRYAHGIVQTVANERRGANGYGCTLTFGPAAVALADETRDTSFRGLSLATIAKRVLSDGLRPFGRAVRFDVRGMGPIVPAVHQQNESDLAFATRLVREAGLSFYFDQPHEHEELVVIDHAARHPLVSSLDDKDIVIRPESATASAETLHAFDTTPHDGEGVVHGMGHGNAIGIVAGTLLCVAERGTFVVTRTAHHLGDIGEVGDARSGDETGYWNAFECIELRARKKA